MNILLSKERSTDLVDNYPAFKNIDYTTPVVAVYVNKDKPDLGVYVSGKELLRIGAESKMINEKINYMVGSYKVVED